MRPALLAQGLGVDSRTAKRTAWLARMFAVRDLALGLGVLDAVRRDGDQEPWLLVGALSDTVDALAITAALRQKLVRPVPAAATIATAVAAAAVGLRSARG